MCPDGYELSLWLLDDDYQCRARIERGAPQVCVASFYDAEVITRTVEETGASEAGLEKLPCGGVRGTGLPQRHWTGRCTWRSPPRWGEPLLSVLNEKSAVPNIPDLPLLRTVWAPPGSRGCPPDIRTAAVVGKGPTYHQSPRHAAGVGRAEPHRVRMIDPCISNASACRCGYYSRAEREDGERPCRILSALNGYLP